MIGSRCAACQRQDDSGASCKEEEINVKQVHEPRKFRRIETQINQEIYQWHRVSYHCLGNTSNLFGDTALVSLSIEELAAKVC